MTLMARPRPSRAAPSCDGPRCGRGSQGSSQPASASSRSSRNAVKPQTRMPSTSKAGDIRPEKCCTVRRLAGSTRSATRTRWTEATSLRSVGATGLGSRHQASTGVTLNPLTGTDTSGRVREDLDAGRVQAGLLDRLPDRRGGRVDVGRVDRAAREGGLAGVGAHLGGALDQQDADVAGLVLARTAAAPPAPRASPWGWGGTRGVKSAGGDGSGTVDQGSQPARKLDPVHPRPLGPRTAQETPRCSAIASWTWAALVN